MKGVEELEKLAGKTLWRNKNNGLLYELLSLPVNKSLENSRMVLYCPKGQKQYPYLRTIADWNYNFTEVGLIGEL